MDNFNQFHVSIFNDHFKESHLHTDLELLYVVEGRVDVKIKDRDFSMKRDDIIVINSSILHSIESKEKSILCSIKFDYRILVHVIKKPNSVFVCNSVAEPGRNYTGIIKSCRDVIYHEVTGYGRTDTLKYSMLYGLLNELIENFMMDDLNGEVSENYDADEKLQIIIRYVHTNYQTGISLSDLARQMYTSTSTLSRLFKKQTGNYFAEYVNQVRTKYAVDELLHTEKNMTRIAMDCGFSNASAFTRMFRETYNMSPTEYKQKMKGTQQEEQGIDESVQEEIRQKFRDDFERPISGNLDEAVVDVTKSTELNHCWNKIINVGFVHDIAGANIQYHITYLKNTLDFKYARIWMVFNTKTLVSDGESVGAYNFDMIYEALDFLVNNGITPWLDFTNRPYANVKNADESLWFEDIRIKFRDKSVWVDLYRQFLYGLVRRYGQKELSEWRFELGLESFHLDYDKFYFTEGIDIIDVFNFVRKEIKKAIPKAQVGYSAAASVSNGEELELIFQRLAGIDEQPDFVSFSLFPYRNVSEQTQDGVKNYYVRTKDNEFEEMQLEKIYHLMEISGLDRSKIVIAEWNLTVSNSNFMNDTVFRGCVFAGSVVKFLLDIKEVGVWMCSDWQCNSFSARNVINGGGGILTKDSIRKPIYYAINMLNNMGNQLVQKGNNYMVTKNAANDYSILCFNPVIFNPAYFIKAENQASVDEVQGFFNYEHKRRLELKLEGVNVNSWYYVQRLSVNRKHGSVIDLWAEFDNDSILARNDIKYMQEMCVPGLSRTRVQSVGNVLTLEIDLEAEEFCELHVFPQY